MIDLQPILVYTVQHKTQEKNVKIFYTQQFNTAST